MFTLSNIKFKDILNIKELEIEAQKITCIVGQSGSGKSTLLKLLNNMLSADSGSLKYNDQDINSYNSLKLRRQIIMLPQNPVMFARTIKDNFSKTLEYTEKEKTNTQKYLKLLKKVGLEHKLEMDASRLSGGEKQRLALARILLLKPAILLLDEPSSALDQKTEESIIKMIVNYIKEEAGTLIMVTHSKSIARKYGEIIINLAQGEVQKIETRRLNNCG